VNSEDLNTENNIISNLLLSSDLMGKVENPEYYFSEWGAEKERQLDDLMLTQGWRRFDWTSVLSDIRIPPKYENEKGIIITGRVTKEFFAVPLRDILVKLNILNEYNDIYTTRTGEKGMFRFENIDYADTVSISLEAYRASGRRNLVIYVDSKVDVRDKEMQYITNQQLTHKGEKAIYKEPPDPDADDPFAEENNKIYRLHEEPSRSNVIIIDETNQNYQTVGQILEGRIPGVVVTGDKVNIRGISSLYLNTDPLFLLDGIPVDGEFAMNMSLYDVQRIEVLKGPETAIYGSRGGNGVIAIYTKRGKFMKKGVLEFDMLGYYSPREFYNPAFPYVDDPFEDDRRTILWVPYISPDINGEYKLTFTTSDIKGKYTIRLEGISLDGTPGYAETNIEVK
jgi:TonB-dependent SusC/RagA subfamily outer membrane receptor